MENDFGFTKKELSVFKKLNTPWKIQDFATKLKYNTSDDTCYSPRSVLKHRTADCLEATIFAAAALRLHGYPPLLVDLRAVRDEDHVLAVFKIKNKWGAIAKSKFLGLRFREPAYSSIRELAMSYFNNYFNWKREYTLREFSAPLNLKRFDKINWMSTEKDLWEIDSGLDKIKHYKIISKEFEKNLGRVPKERAKLESIIIPKGVKTNF